MDNLPSYSKVKRTVKRYLLDQYQEQSIVSDQIAAGVAAGLFEAIHDARLQMLSDDVSTNQTMSSDTVKNKWISIQLNSVKINVSLLFVLKQLFLALSCIILMLISSLRLGRRGNPEESLCLVLGLTHDQIYKQSSISSLHNFLMEKRFSFNQDVSDFLIESRNLRSTKYKSVRTVYDVALHLFAHYLPVKIRVRIIYTSLNKLIWIIFNLPKSAIYLVKVKQILLDIPTGKYLSELQLISHILTTPSTAHNSPALIGALRASAQSEMIWYSNNSIPIKSKDRFVDLFDSSFYPLEEIDVHYVWTQSHADYLAASTGSEIKVVGSMLFYPKTDSATKFSKNFCVQVFDVTPVNRDFFEHLFNNTRDALENINQIIQLVDEIQSASAEQVTLNIKPKRQYSSSHKSEYVDHLKSLARAEKLNLVNSKMDLYNLIASSHFVICTPYTSPAIIAQELGIPVCYFSTSKDFDLLESLDGIPVHKSVEALRTHIECTLADYSKAKSEES